MAVREGDLLWTPAASVAEDANITHYVSWLREQEIKEFVDYSSLQKWSAENPEAFWESVWKYFEIRSDTPYARIVDSLEMAPGRKWFEGSRVNFAEHVLRNARAGKTALFHCSEARQLDSMSWDQLSSSVRRVATAMRNRGVKPGDSVCAIMPNAPETVIAMLATISIGAIWSSAAPEFGVQSILDRFQQLKPSWLFVIDGYQFGGKAIDRKEDAARIVEALSDSLKQVVFLPYLRADSVLPLAGAIQWRALAQEVDPGEDTFRFERVPYDHPLWVLFTSGTTGLPKGVVHSHVGVLLEMHKFLSFHLNLKPDDISFFYTTTGWIMFNILVGMLMFGGASILYDGNPAWPTPDTLWKIAAETRATFFGASPAYVQAMQAAKIIPKEKFDLSSLRSIMCSGSPVTPESFAWLYDSVKADIWVHSQSGGTEIASAFVGGAPTLSVYAGEIQAITLGMDVDSWNENRQSLRGEVGELVCKTPFPSMPLRFLGDVNHARYRDAYFSEFLGVWRHGDFIKINERGGCYIYGRSDSILNRRGVRIGTAELYRTVEQLPDIVDSLVVCIESPGEEPFMPMFLHLRDGVCLTPELEREISAVLRIKCSPRHVPDAYYQVGAIPYTLTGKKLEVPVRRLLSGEPPEKVASQGSMKNPHAFAEFIAFAENLRSIRSMT